MFRTTHFNGRRIEVAATRLHSAEMPAPGPGESNNRASRINGNGHGSLPPGQHGEVTPELPPPPPMPTVDEAVDEPLILDEPLDEPDGVEPRKPKGRRR